MRLSRVMLLAILLDHISQSMNLEAFHAKENERCVQCEEELHPAEKQHPLGIVDLLIGRKFPAFDSNLLF